MWLVNLKESLNWFMWLGEESYKLFYAVFLRAGKLSYKFRFVSPYDLTVNLVNVANLVKAATN